MPKNEPARPARQAHLSRLEICGPPERVRRPEVMAAEEVVRMRAQMLAKARSSFSPVLNAFGSCDWDSGGDGGFEGSYLVGITAEWDLFTGFQRGHMAAQARAELEAARSEAGLAANQTRLDLRQAELALGEALERLDVARRSVDSAREAARITRERYRQGAADITVLLTAELGLTATETRRVAAYYDWRVAQSNLARAGGLLAERYLPAPAQLE